MSLSGTSAWITYFLFPGRKLDAWLGCRSRWAHFDWGQDWEAVVGTSDLSEDEPE